MILKKLSILNYKNILQAEVAFSPKMNCFFGNNGMGKTNLLDVIHYLSFCKSHINTPDSQIINNDQDMCVIQGEYDYEETRIYSVLSAVASGNSSNGIKRNMISCPNTSDSCLWLWCRRRIQI